MFNVTVQLLKEMEDTAKSPQDKLKCLSSAIISLGSTYALAYPGKKKQASADFIIPALVLVLLQAKLSHPTALYKFMKHFKSISEEAGLYD